MTFRAFALLRLKGIYGSIRKNYLTDSVQQLSNRFNTFNGIPLKAALALRQDLCVAQLTVVLRRPYQKAHKARPPNRLPPPTQQERREESRPNRQEDVTHRDDYPPPDLPINTTV